MSAEFEIKIIKNADIDRHAYDICVGGATNSLIYAWSFYLDRMAPGWDMVAGSYCKPGKAGHIEAEDYEFAMPLVSKRKWGVSYLYQPTFVQQLGIFSSRLITEEIAGEMIELAKKEFAFAEIHLHYLNPVRWLSKRSNFILDLSPAYSLLSGSYSRDLKNNLKQSLKKTLHYTDAIPLELCLNNFQQEYSARLPTVNSVEYANFADLCRHAGSDFELVIRGIKDEQNNVIATALMPKKDRRLYLLQSWVSPVGKSCKANHYLVDQIIREFAESNLVLDFEGSDVPGIAAFYTNYGAVDQPYYFLQWNNLPFMPKQIKAIKDVLRRSK